jgi:hypothetical protein
MLPAFSRLIFRFAIESHPCLSSGTASSAVSARLQSRVAGLHGANSRLLGSARIHVSLAGSKAIPLAITASSSAALRLPAPPSSSGLNLTRVKD